MRSTLTKTGIQKFSIDDHDLTVIAEDFVPVKPYNTKVVTLGVGQRTDILVTAHADPKTSVWMRTQMPGGVICGSNDNTQVIRAGVFYEDANTDIPPASISENNDANCVNEPLTRTEPRRAKAITPDPLQLDLVLSLEISDTGVFLWKINDHTYTPNLSDPLLFRDDLASVTGDTVFNPGNAQSVRLNVTNTTPIPHPFHLHGNHFQILASGPDVATSSRPNTASNPIVPPPPTLWDGTIEVSTSNPPRRDVHIVPALGYTVFQFDTSNPGVWPFHCHTAWHLAGGMSINFVVKPDQIASIPAGTKDNTCAAWSEWASATSFEPAGLGR